MEDRALIRSDHVAPFISECFPEAADYIINEPKADSYSGAAVLTYDDRLNILPCTSQLELLLP